MKLFLISQDQNTGYDTYDSAVVVAETEEKARNMDPSTGEQMTKERWNYPFSGWCTSPEYVRVEYLGEAVWDEECVVCASFNAG